MAKYKVKVQLLVRGFPLIEGNYELDGFNLKKNKMDVNEFNQAIESEEFDTRIYMGCIAYRLPSEKKLTYYYFERIIDYSIETTKKDKSDLSRVLIENKTIQDDINFLEKKLRLIYNLPIKFPIRKFFIYDKDNLKIDQITSVTSMPNNDGLLNFDSNEFYQKSKFNICIKSINNVENKNQNFKTAMNFFYNSFDIEDKNIRFILLFSALEAIFNLRNINNTKIFKFSEETTDEEKITTVISVLSSKFLFFDSVEATTEKEERIRYLYKQRGNYIHGKKIFDIDATEEKELREYVRQILILYFLCCDSIILNKKENLARRVLVDIHVNEKLSIMHQAVADTLRSESYQESYARTIDKVNKGIAQGSLEILEMENGYVTKVNENL